MVVHTCIFHHLLSYCFSWCPANSFGVEGIGTLIPLPVVWSSFLCLPASSSNPSQLEEWNGCHGTCFTGRRNGNHISWLLSKYCRGLTSICGIQGSLQVCCIMRHHLGYTGIDKELSRTTTLQCPGGSVGAMDKKCFCPRMCDRARHSGTQGMLNPSVSNHGTRRFYIKGHCCWENASLFPKIGPGEITSCTWVKLGWNEHSDHM